MRLVPGLPRLEQRLQLKTSYVPDVPVLKDVYAEINFKGDLVIDEERFEATCHGKPVSLTATEFRILAAMVKNAGRVLSRTRLLDILGETYEGYERTIDVHIKNLRRKLAEVSAGKECNIITVHGVGYKLQEPKNV